MGVRSRASGRRRDRRRPAWRPYGGHERRGPAPRRGRAVNRESPRGPIAAAVGAGLLVVLFGYLDFRTGPAASFTISYLIPVLLAARYGHRGVGIATAAASSVAMVVAEQFGPQVTPPLVDAWNLVSRFGLLASVAVLVRSLRTQLAVASHQARTDALTGVVSRGRFLQLLEGEVRRTRRYGHALSLAYLDVDDFKEVNDTHGHHEGDRLLRTIADVLRDETRDIDVAGRVGGDEFMLLMPETDANDARALVERLQGALRETSRTGGLPATFSIGLLTFVRVPDDPEGAVQQVDGLMYEVKRGGKDGFLHQVVD